MNGDELVFRTRVQQHRTLPASMRPMRRRAWIAGILAGLSLPFLVAWDPAPKPAPAIQEDDPRWDCRTMGNHICGPGAPHPAGYYGN